jgi:hypothetical protein
MSMFREAEESSSIHEVLSIIEEQQNRPVFSSTAKKVTFTEEMGKTTL